VDHWQQQQQQQRQQQAHRLIDVGALLCRQG
jgi:poly-gamma-glutamate capsule biosynthesis protein CapA/YwtB (metallophosphatase superfamily)